MKNPTTLGMDLTTGYNKNIMITGCYAILDPGIRIAISMVTGVSTPEKPSHFGGRMRKKVNRLFPIFSLIFATMIRFNLYWHKPCGLCMQTLFSGRV